jgi:hypothetical protein
MICASTKDAAESHRWFAKCFLALMLSTAVIVFRTDDLRAQGNDFASISLDRPDGSSVAVPLEGPLQNDTAELIAREIQAIDKIIASRNASPKSEVDSAVLEVAHESRNDALKQLDLALRIAQQTSSGQLDGGLLRKAKQYSEDANETLLSQVPSFLFVTTQITTSVADATMHYISKGDYDAKRHSWMSYSPGDKIRIGRYVFRVEPSDPVADIYEELVLVVKDPTQRTLRPIRK